MILFFTTGSSLFLSDSELEWSFTHELKIHQGKGSILIQLDFIKNLQFSACSGLIKLEGRFFTVADDQLSLEIFSASENEASTFFQLTPGHLPDDPKERKRIKPDFETLLFIPDQHFPPDGIILALPSGSTSHRSQGAMLALGKNKTLPEKASPVDFSILFQHLRHLTADLNLEGAAISGSTLKLFQRGNGAKAENAVIDLDFDIFLKELLRTQKITAQSFQSWHSIALPCLNGDQLGFTDAAIVSTSPGSPLWFLAAAERTVSTYEDGSFSGAALGCLNSDHEVIHISHLACAEKPEGLWIDTVDPSVFYIVTDADDPSKHSHLLKGKLPKIP